jgi:hypothetical protein
MIFAEIFILEMVLARSMESWEGFIRFELCFSFSIISWEISEFLRSEYTKDGSSFMSSFFEFLLPFIEKSLWYLKGVGCFFFERKSEFMLSSGSGNFDTLGSKLSNYYE